MNFGVSANFNFGGFSMNQSSTTKVTTNSSVSANIEANLKSQYEVKLKNWETKFNQSQVQIKQITTKAREFELTNQVNLKKFETEKANIMFHLNRYKSERDSIKDENAKMRDELNKLRGGSSTNTKLISDMEATIRSLQEKVNAYEAESKKKYERMAAIESELLKAKNELILEDQDDTEMLAKLKAQQELVAKMSLEIQAWVKENEKDDNEIATLKNLVSEKDQEITVLKEHLENVKTSFNSSTYIEITSIETCEVYINLENRLNLIVTERDNLICQINVKDAIIKDMEIKIKSQNEKIAILYRTINDLKAHMETYENRELEYKKTLDEYLLRLNQVTITISSYTTKITTLEGLIVQKDQQIKKYSSMVKERDDKITIMKQDSVNSTKELQTAKENLEIKLKEISEWKQEDARDNTKIDELLSEMARQSDIIKGWEAENNKDDKRIADLEAQIVQYEQKIELLNNFLNEVRAKFEEYVNFSLDFNIYDETMSSSIVTKTKLEVEQSSAYLSLQANLDIQLQTISTLQAEIENYRQQLRISLEEKAQLQIQLDEVNKQMEVVNSTLNAQVNLKLEAEAKFERQLQTTETEQTQFITANSRVDEFKIQIVNRKNQMDEVYLRIDAMKSGVNVTGEVEVKAEES
jgi:chromosome segregation ATPase